MMYENEILMLLIGFIVLAFSVVYHKALKTLPFWNILFLSYISLLFAWVCTILEGFIWGELFDPLEHIFYLLSSLTMLLWVWKSINLSVKAP